MAADNPLPRPGASLLVDRTSLNGADVDKGVGSGAGVAQGSSSGPAKTQSRCLSCEMTGELMYRLFTFTKEAAFYGSFAAQKDAWAASCRSAGSGRALADCLLILEAEFRPSFVNGKWGDIRQNWEYKLQSLPYQDCSQVVLLMYEFESYVLWKAVEEDWRKERKQWAKELRQLYPAGLRTLSDALLSLEKSVLTRFMSIRWQSERARWLHRTCFCRCLEELAKSLVTLESRMGPSALVESWRDERAAWLASVQSSDINCARLAPLILDLERSFVPEVVQPQWQHMRRAWVLSVNNIAGVGR